MKKQTTTIQLDNGLEVRPVAMLVQLASQFDSTIYLETDNKRVNAKSIMGMMSLGLIMGADVVVEADGTDEDVAVEKIVNYLSGKEA
ncbi:MAG: HPr family phosphocarrier protein [Lachnospiraceae bacterium]|nr:HPr family phosphocarrier protein [Lachnospiraceae bacterium]MBR3683532.1 HPr family phosphocarrier protein [Lachnospiraceae bacterium]